MIHAELRGKLSSRNENREDILTSNVFSFFQYAERQVFLHKLLTSWGLRITEHDAREAKFQYWPKFPDGTEPDLVIVVGDYYVLIEAKYRSGFGEETALTKAQLVREAEGGAAEAGNLRFKLIAVTADPYLRAEVRSQVPDGVSFQWINWQRIALLIYQILESGVSLQAETKAFAKDLYDLFLSKKLRSYEGLTVLGDLKGRLVQRERVFFNASTASYRGSFFGFLAALELEARLIQLADRIFFGPTRNPFSSLGETTCAIQPHEGAIFFVNRRPVSAIPRGAEASVSVWEDPIFKGRER